MSIHNLHNDEFCNPPKRKCWTCRGSGVKPEREYTDEDHKYFNKHLTPIVCSSCGGAGELVDTR